MENKDILDQELFKPIPEGFSLEPVSKEIRVANFIIDRIVVVLIVVVFGVVFSENALLASIFSEIEEGGISGRVIDMIFTAFFVVIYYSIIEAATEGRSIGKWITGTRAINNDGSLMRTETAVRRSLYRAVPFEVFSFFGETGWHDAWSETSVVKEKDFQKYRF